MSLWRRRSCRILPEGGKMARVRVADDFNAIRLRLEELCREPAPLHTRGPYTDHLCRTSRQWRSLEWDRSEPEIVFVHISVRTQRVAGINAQAAPRHQVPEAIRSF